MGRKKIYDSDDPAERLRMAKKKYEQTAKAKERKRKYNSKSEVKNINCGAAIDWYHRQKELDPDFLKKRAEATRIRRAEKKQQDISDK